MKEVENKRILKCGCIPGISACKKMESIWEMYLGGRITFEKYIELRRAHINQNQEK